MTDPDIAIAVTKMFSYIAKVKAAAEHNAALRGAMQSDPLLDSLLLPRELMNEVYDLIGAERMAEMRRIHSGASAASGAAPRHF